MKRRFWLHFGSVFILSLFLFVVIVGVQPVAAYPEKDIRIIQPYPSGGFSDVMIRKLIDVITQKKLLSKDVIAVAMTGANARNAMQTVLNSQADGHTMLMHHTQFVTAFVSGQLPISYKDYDMIGGLCAGPIVLDIAKDGKWNSIEEMVTDVKANPGKYSMALPGTGGTAHIAGMHFMKLAGIPFNAMRYLPLSGGSETLKAVLGKKVDIRIATAADSLRSVLSGDTRALLVLSHQELPAFKNVKNLKDLGYPDSLPIRLGLFAPKGTPQEVKDKWAEILKITADDPGFQAFSGERGSPAKFVPADQWAKEYEADTELVKSILKDVGHK